MIIFTVEGAPVGKQRPRVCLRGNRAHAFTPKKTEDYERTVSLRAKEAMLKGGIGMYSDKVALTVGITAYFPVPSSWSKAKRERALTGELAHITKPDIDNVCKAVMDGMSGIVYGDDKQINKIECGKAYSENPRVEVIVYESRLNREDD